MQEGLSEILTIAALYLSGVILPGPNFVATAHRAVTRPRQEALALVGGIALVNMIWALAAVGGIVALFTAAPWLFMTIKLAGGAYLLWLGISLWRGARAPLSYQAQSSRAGLKGAFRSGVLINLGNAKAMLFFAGIFAAAMPADPSVLLAGIIVLMVGSIAFLWYGGVALLLSFGGAAAGYRRAKPWIDRGCGLLLGGLGLRLVAQEAKDWVPGR